LELSFRWLAFQLRTFPAFGKGRWAKALAKIRLMVRIAKGANPANAWAGAFHSVDQSPDWWAGGPLESITLEGRGIQFKLDKRSR
jgi:hypothetical protein